MLPIALVLLVGSLPASAQSAATVGQWQTLSYLMPINPIHVALMHTGKVLVVAGSGNYPANLTNNILQAAVWDPQAGTISVQSTPWDMFCNAMVVLPDGRPFINGGTVQYDPFHGSQHAAIFDPATNSFSTVASMAHGRWYPTTTVLADGTVMTFSGLDTNGNTTNTTEIFNPSTGVWSTAYSASWTPPLYPRMHLLPNGNVFYSGSSPTSAIFDTSKHTWTTNVATTNYGSTRTYGSSVLFPLTPANNYAPKVMILGGGSPATNTTEIIDLSIPNPQWQYAASMYQGRIEMNAVLLPNGKVLALGGSVTDEDATTASLQAEIYDPAANTFSPAGTEAYARLYHSVALLMPDGTVWVAGGNPQRGTYEQHMEIYSPPYLFTADANGNVFPAARPTISSAPASVGYGAGFTVQTPDAANISSVVLMRIGADTHAFDMDQRMVGLSFTTGSGSLTVTGPPNSNIAPPGYYMLFLLNNARVPSIANFVQVVSEPQVSTPTFSPGTGTYSSAQTVTISSTTSGATICYTTDGSNPTATTPGICSTGATLANGASVMVSASETLKAIATESGFTNSGVGSAAYTITNAVAMPTFNPGSGTYSSAQSVTITSTTSGATICYTTNGSTPAASTPGTCSTGTTLANGASVTVSASETLNAIGTKSSFTNSGVASATYTIGTVPIAFVQVAAATPLSSQSTVSVAYPAAQTAGDLNVIVVGWNDTTASVSTVTDTAGNTYQLAIGPTVGTGLSQSIYYAANIKAAAGTNTVTVTFNQAAVFVDLRILEYRGVNTPDAKVGASGTGGTSNSGSASTNVANELIFAANTVANTTTAAGTGFTSRIITQPDQDIAEDQVVTTTGSYSSTAALSGSGAWVMQMVTFNVASGSPATVATPTFSPGTGTYSSAQTVTVSSTTTGATICYTTDGSNPGATTPGTCSAGTPLANGASVMVSSSETLKAIGTESGFSNSAVGSGSYTISNCVQNLAIGNFTLCGESYNDVSTGANVQVNYRPSPNNGIVAWATWCFNSSCNSSISGVTGTIGDNINATESCFVASPHSPFITNANGGAEGSGDFQQHYVWYCPSIPSGVTSFTVTPSNPNLSYLQLNISEWKAGSLAASCSPISACFEDVDNLGQAGNSTGGTTATITTSGSTVNANDLIFAVTEVPCCSFTASPGTGYTGITVAPSVTPGMVSEAKAATATGIQTATTTWTGGSTPWFGVIVPLKEAGAAPVVATPTLSPGTGTYSSAQTVTISSTTSGATICYTTDGSNPTATTPGLCSTGTTLANGASVTVSASETLKAIGTESGFTNSGIGSATYTIAVATPTFSPGAGTYSSGQTVTISSTTSGATICYTTDGSNPTATTPGLCSAGTTLANGASVTVSSSETLKAIGTKSGFSNSGIGSATYTIGTVPIAFVQVAAATPLSPQSTVSVLYPAVQTAGDLNVVVVGWNDSTSNVIQVQDSQNNTYAAVTINPIRGTGLSQAIYYASNIKAGSNTVTVTFNQAAVYVDLRVLEYTGVSTLDTTAGASGTGSTANSGAATTTVARELIFGANTVVASTTGAGANFTSRIITQPDADIAEDRIVSATGSYSATAPLTGNAPWVMQMVTFK